MPVCPQPILAFTSQPRKNNLRDERKHDVASYAPALTSHQAVEVANKAQAAFPAWAALGPNARREMLTKAAAALTSKSDAFAEAMMAETAATRGWGMFHD